VTRLFDSHTEALAAVEELERAGISHSRISLVANNAEGWHKGDRIGRDNDADDDNETAEGAAEGATAGGVIGGGLGLAAGLGMLAIPGLGPVVAAGWLASTAVGAIAGAVAGGATGGLLGALKDAGHSDEDAHVYAEGVRRGGSLVSVKPDDAEEAALAEGILQSQSGVTAAERGSLYRQSGWTQFDESADPYGAEEITAERNRYREQRSFQRTEDYSVDADADEARDNAGISNPLGGPRV
jgi:hypothetical protein